MRTFFRVKAPINLKLGRTQYMLSSMSSLHGFYTVLLVPAKLCSTASCVKADCRNVDDLPRNKCDLIFTNHKNNGILCLQWLLRVCIIFHSAYLLGAMAEILCLLQGFESFNYQKIKKTLPIYLLVTNRANLALQLFWYCCTDKFESCFLNNGKR